MIGDNLKYVSTTLFIINIDSKLPNEYYYKNHNYYLSTQT